MSAPTIHPVATAHRVAKVRRIVAFIDAHPEQFHDFTSEDFAHAGDDLWRIICRQMAERSDTMSDLTKTGVIAFLAAREMVTDTQDYIL